MPVEIPRAIFDRWVIALEPLTEADIRPKSESYPDGGTLMSPRQVLVYLQHSSSGTHTVETDEYEPDRSHKKRVVAMSDVVLLDPDGIDEARARDVIRNAEYLTGIKLDAAGTVDVSL